MVPINDTEDIKRLIESVEPENRKNIKGFMIGRAALENPDCFLEINKSLGGFGFIARSIKEIKAEFNGLCNEHIPKEIYLRMIGEKVFG